jgi:hypothetical protein
MVHLGGILSRCNLFAKSILEGFTDQQKNYVAYNMFVFDVVNTDSDC